MGAYLQRPRTVLRGRVLEFLGLFKQTLHRCHWTGSRTTQLNIEKKEDRLVLPLGAHPGF